MCLKFGIVGGDARQALLAGLLRRDGHRVCTYALERAGMDEEIPRAGCLQGCVYGADCVVLPTPAEAGGFLFAPLSAEKPIGPLPSAIAEAPTLEVITMSVLRKSTSRPEASQRRPASMICSRMPRTSSCAF